MFCSVLESGQLQFHHGGPFDPFEVVTQVCPKRIFKSATFRIEVSKFGDIAIVDFVTRRVDSPDWSYMMRWTASACVGPAGYRLWILADREGANLVLTEFNCVGSQGHKFRVLLPAHVACLPGPRLVRRVAAVGRFVAVEFCGPDQLGERLYFFARDFGLGSWRTWLPQFKHLKLAGWTALTSEKCFVLCFQNGTILKFGHS
jgi:hypothetical protein